MTNPFTPPPGGSASASAQAIGARFISSAGKPAANSATTFVTICASTPRVPASRATSDSVPDAASAQAAASSSDSIPVAGSASAQAVRAVVAAAGEDAVSAAMSAPPSSSCWPNGRCTATR